MWLLLPALLLFAPALMLLLLRILRPGFRFAWLISVSAAFFAWISVVLWQPQLPLSMVLPSGNPTGLLSAAPAFSADGLSWPFALGLVTLAVAVLLTAAAGDDFPNSLAWALSLTLCGLGLLAVTANNPFTLVMVWAALDLAEVVIMLQAANGRNLSERAVIAFSVHAAGIVLALLAQVIGSLAAKTVDLVSLPPQAGLLLLVAAGLRLGVFPVHLPYGSETALHRGVGTVLRLVSAASSLILLARIPPASLASPFTPVLLILAMIAAFYGGWMWLRAPDELTGRPYWVVGLASLAVASALRGNPAGATAWGTTLILAGGALFLASVQQVWLNRLILIGAWSASALPFSLSALGWIYNAGSFDWSLPAFILAQALMMAGFARHALRPSTRPALESQAAWAKSVYPVGIGLLLFVQILLGVWGWTGALQVGAWIAGLAALLLASGLLWAIPRFPALNPVLANWQQSASHSRIDRVYQNLWDVYRWLGRLGQTISDILEGDGGIMWTLLFLILFITLIVQRRP